MRGRSPSQRQSPSPARRALLHCFVRVLGVSYRSWVAWSFTVLEQRAAPALAEVGRPPKTSLADTPLATLWRRLEPRHRAPLLAVRQQGLPGVLVTQLRA